MALQLAQVLGQALCGRANLCALAHAGKPVFSRTLLVRAGMDHQPPLGDPIPFGPGALYGKRHHFCMGRFLGSFREPSRAFEACLEPSCPPAASEGRVRRFETFPRRCGYCSFATWLVVWWRRLALLRPIEVGEATCPSPWGKLCAEGHTFSALEGDAAAATG